MDIVNGLHEFFSEAPEYGIKLLEQVCELWQVLLLVLMEKARGLAIA